MRDPGTEPLVMIGSDVVELTKMIYAEREAHAAEVARLRVALSLASKLDSLHKPYCPCAAQPFLPVESCTCGRWEAVGAINEALAAPTTAAAQAVEGMRKALESLVAEINEADNQCEGEILGECPALADAYIEARAALAAWKEVTRG